MMTRARFSCRRIVLSCLICGLIAVEYFVGINLLHSVSRNRILQQVMDAGAPEVNAADRYTMDTSACLTTKDDLMLLPEWISYHYHTMQLRHLMIAEDPHSVTNLSAVLEPFRQELPDLKIRVYQETEYMPKWFLDKKYGRVRDYKKKASETKDPIERERQLIYVVHLTRQRTFARFCTLVTQERRAATGNSTKSDHRNLLMHIDSDEFIVPNPKWRSDANITSFLPSPGMPREATAGSLIRYLNQVHEHFPDKHPYPRPDPVCNIMMMVPFGGLLPHMFSKEEADEMKRFPSRNWIEATPEVPSPLNASRFETVAFRYHKSIVERLQYLDMGSTQKTIMDVDSIPNNDRMMREKIANSIHVPSPKLCRTRNSQKNRSDLHRDPLSVNHYKGSLERFTFRDDIARTPERYASQAMLKDQMDDGWITTWVEQFAAVQGIDKVMRLLGEHFANGRPNAWTTTRATV